VSLTLYVILPELFLQYHNSDFHLRHREENVRWAIVWSMDSCSLAAWEKSWI